MIQVDSSGSYLLYEFFLFIMYHISGITINPSNIDVIPAGKSVMSIVSPSDLPT